MNPYRTTTRGPKTKRQAARSFFPSHEHLAYLFTIIFAAFAGLVVAAIINYFWRC